ncbi:MAG TPA: cell division protein FtsK [Clostridiales bacterium]|nr:cell division protein FtsK [Clostridiales bacterium]
MESVFGDMIRDLIFGVCGLLGYIVPVLLGIIGVLIIAARKKTANAGKLTLLALAVFFVFSLAHLSVIERIFISGDGFFAFAENSYKVGVTDAAGGGVIGSLLTYWTFRFLEIAGSYIVCLVGIIACLLALTNLSLKKMGQELAGAVKTTYDVYRERAEREKEQRRLFVERLDEEEQQRAEHKKDDEFNMRIQAFDESMDRQYEEMLGEEQELAKAAIEEYDPQPYREVFSDTDIEFDGAGVPEVRGRRRLDLSLHTEVPAAKQQEEEQVPHDTRPVPVVHDLKDGEVRKLPKYVRPPLNLLDQAEKDARHSSAELRKNVDILESTLLSFNVSAKVVNVSRGPVVTRYEVQPESGVKVSKIVNLADDIAMNLSARDVRIEAPVPGKPVVGIEIPNNKTSSVGIRELIGSEQFRNLKSTIAFTLGKDIAGENVFADIAKMPHLLIAGSTGSGKSVCINSLIVSILYHSAPEDVRMIMIDPKVVELNVYNDIPHLLVPVVTDPKKASSAVNWAVNEMTLRYRMFAAKGSKDLAKYNEIMLAAGEEKLPQILVIIDELADLMMVAPKEIEEAICRIAQLGRASGIHLVIATQRPSVDVITGIIKANIPSRIAFAVSSQIDSRTILDMPGAEKLLGQGDMLFFPTGLPKPVRVQGCFISEKEVEAVAAFLKKRTEPKYDSKVMDGMSKDAATAMGGSEETDELFIKAIELVLEYEQASTSMLQRRLRIGYARAARLIDQMEEAGAISAPDGSKPRQVLISRAQFEQMYRTPSEDAEYEL